MVHHNVAIWAINQRTRPTIGVRGVAARGFFPKNPFPGKFWRPLAMCMYCARLVSFYLRTALTVAISMTRSKGSSKPSFTIPPMSLSLTDIDSEVLLSVVEHVFLPPKLPQEATEEDTERKLNVALCHVLIHVAAAFRRYLPPSGEFVWDRMLKMMGFISRAASAPLVEAELVGALSDLRVGGGLELPPAFRMTDYLCFQMSS